MKEIEEMAKKICGRDYATCLDCVNETKRIIKHANINECECYCYAKKFYNAGYRKVGDEYEFVKGYLPYTKQLKEQVRKATAKEILQTLYNNLKNPQFFKVYIETIAEKYGVEIEGE